MKIGKIARGPEYRMDEPFQNVQIFGIFIVFQIEKILKICWFVVDLLIIQFAKFQKFPI